MSVIDFVAARAVAQAHLLETAVHDPGPWSVRAEGMSVPAVKVVTPSRVVFLARFEEHPGTQVETVELWLRDRMVSSRDDLYVPSTGGFCVEWSLGGAAPREADVTAGV